MTRAVADKAAFFGWGDLRHTLAGEAVKDLSRACARDVTDIDRALATLEDPLLAPGLDEEFLALLADDVEREEDLAYAELAFHVARTRRSPQARRLLELLLEFALSDPPRAGYYARVGLEELAEEDSPLFVARCQGALGQSLFVRGEYASAAKVFADGAEHAHEAGDPARECDLLGAATAAQQMLDHWPQALSLADRWIEVARALGDARRLGQSLGQRGNAEMKLGRADAARTDFEEALVAAAEAGDDQTLSNWLGNLGDLALVDGDYDEAIRRHTEALELSRRLGSLESMEQDLENLARAYWRANAWDDALRYQREAVAVAERRGDPTWITKNREILQRMYSDLGRHEHARALRHLQDEAQTEADAVAPDAPPAGGRALSRPPEDPELDAELDEAQRGGGPDALLQLLDERIAGDPENALLRVKRGIILAALQRWEPALQAYEQAIELAPRWLIPHMNAINVWEGLEDLDTPRARYERMVGDDPFDPLPRVVLGRIYRCEARHDEAVRELREALRLAPGTYDITWELAYELDELAREQLTEDWSGAWAVFEECMVLLEQLPQLAPEARPRALADAGRLYIRMAEESTRANPPFLSWLGDRELDLWVRAIIKLTEAAPALTPDWPRRLLSYAMNLLVNMQDVQVATEAGKAFDRHGYPDLAVTMLENAVVINPNPPEPRYELARLLADRPSERARAVELAESVLRVAPDHVDARGLLARLRRESG